MTSFYTEEIFRSFDHQTPVIANDELVTSVLTWAKPSYTCEDRELNYRPRITSHSVDDLRLQRDRTVESRVTSKLPSILDKTRTHPANSGRVVFVDFSKFYFLLLCLDRVP
jgi:hypothetical protein